MMSGAASAAVDGAAAKVDVQIMARSADAEADQAFRLRDGGVLRSGDGVQLRIASESRAYVYVIAYGPSHSAILLHPFSGRAQDALVEADAMRIIPGAGVFLPLDGQEGSETVFSIVSDTPLEDVSGLLAGIEGHGEDLDAIMALVTERYAHARRFTFRHIGMRPLVGLAAVAPRRESSPGSFDAGIVGAPRSTPGEPSPGEGGWSVPSAAESFDSGTPTATAAAPAVAPAAAVEKGAASAAFTAGEAGAAESAVGQKKPGGEPSENVSRALRRAREAAGIDAEQFRGILATLPTSGTGEVPAAITKDHRESGVLSAEGSRIRVLDGVQVESVEGYPASGSSESSTQ